MTRSVLVVGVSVLLSAGLLAPAVVAPAGASAPSVITAVGVLTAKKKAKGTLRVTVTGSGTYTVTGKGLRKTAHASKSFKVNPGPYKVQAPGGTVSPGKVTVKAGKTAKAQVVFPAQASQDPEPTTPAPPPETPAPPAPVVTTPPPPADTTAPGPVTGLTVGTRTPTSIALSWTNPGDADLVEVVVRRAQGNTPPATPAAGTAVTLPSPTATSVTDSGLAADTGYAYSVFTRDTTGNTTTTPVTTTARTGPPVTGGAVQRVSTDATGTQANSSSYGQVWSPDGTRIAFYAWASNLVPGDTNSAKDVFVKTLATGEIQRASTDATGTQANSESGDPVWSPDGTRIAFDSEASNLVPGDTNGAASDVFVKTLATGAIQRISTDATGTQANSWSFDPVWSPDGTRIAFGSTATNLVPGDTNSAKDVFVKTLATGAIQRISTDTTGNQATGGDTDTYHDAAWSPDGTRIAFGSTATNLVPGDTNAKRDVFVKTLATGAIQRVSTDTTDTQANHTSYRPVWSPDGTQIAFQSQASNLVPGDTNAWEDVFVKTLATGAIQRVSTDTTGTQANGESYGPVWSPDGTRIAFSSDASNLVPGDTNGWLDVFVKTLATGEIQRVSTDTTGTQANGESYGPVWSPDGTRIAFSSDASNLVPGDTNNTDDVFVKTLP